MPIFKEKSLWEYNLCVHYRGQGMEVVTKEDFFCEMQGYEILKHLYRSKAFSFLELIMTLIKLVHFNENKWFTSITKAWIESSFMYILIILF